MTTYTTRAAVMQAIAYDRRINAADVSPRVLASRVWVSGAGSPGCLYDNGPAYHTSKSDAIAYCVFIAGDDAPRGFATSLKRCGIADSEGMRYEVGATTIGAIL